MASSKGREQKAYCAGTTAAGQDCRRIVGPEDYCHQHQLETPAVVEPGFQGNAGGLSSGGGRFVALPGNCAALTFDLVLVTRNISDVQGLGAQLLNPFEDG